MRRLTRHATRVCTSPVFLLRVIVPLAATASGRPYGSSRGELARLVSTPLKLPRCFESILDGADVASSDVSDDHHVLAEPRRHAEGLGEVLQHRGAAVEGGADHHMGVVKLGGR